MPAAIAGVAAVAVLGTVLAAQPFVSSSRAADARQPSSLDRVLAEGLVAPEPVPTGAAGRMALVRLDSRVQAAETATVPLVEHLVATLARPTRAAPPEVL